MILGLTVLAARESVGTRKRTSTKPEADMQAIENDSRPLINKTLEYHQETKNTIHDLTDIVGEHTGQLQTIDRGNQAYGKANALIKEYENQFNILRTYTNEINREAADGRASQAFLKLTKTDYWDEPAAKWSELNRCTFKMNGTDILLQYEAVMPVPDKQVKILEATSFQIWNRTSENTHCWTKYVEPKYVIYNTTNNCFWEAESYWIDKESITSHGCLETDGKMKEPENLFISENCYKTLKDKQDRLQIKHTSNKV